MEITGILNNVFRRQKKTLKKTRIKLHNTLALPVFLYGSETWTIKARGAKRLRTKIVIDNKIIEQVNLFKYLGNMISYEGELDIDNKLNNFLQITGILNKVFRPQKNP